MSEVIPFKKKNSQGFSDLYEALDTKLRDIYTVADLLSEVDSDNIGCDQINATGYCLTRMIKKAQKKHKALWKAHRGGAK